MVNIICFVVGARVGQKVSKGEEIKLPVINPLEDVREHNKNKKADEAMSKVKKIMQNIERYDGTGAGQQDV